MESSEIDPKIYENSAHEQKFHKGGISANLNFHKHGISNLCQKVGLFNIWC